MSTDHIFKVLFFTKMEEEQLLSIQTYVTVTDKYEKVKETREKCIASLKVMFQDYDKNSRDFRHLIMDRIMVAMGLKARYIHTFNQLGKHNKPFEDQRLKDERKEIYDKVYNWYRKFMKDIKDVPEDQTVNDKIPEPVIVLPTDQSSSTEPPTNSKRTRKSHDSSSTSEPSTSKRPRPPPIVPYNPTSKSSSKSTTKSKSGRPELLFKEKDFKLLSTAKITSKAKKEIIEAAQKIIDRIYGSDKWEDLSYRDLKMILSNHSGMRYGLYLVSLEYIENYPRPRKSTQPDAPAEIVPSGGTADST